MKPIYIDITNLLKLPRYTGISRVVSECILRLAADGMPLCLLSYNIEQHAYQIANKDRFLLTADGLLADKEECLTAQFVRPEELVEGSSFLELNSSWHTLPSRSELLPILKNKQIRIFVLIHDIIPIRCPQYMVPQTLLRFMEFITAHMTYADDIIVTSQAVADDLTQLFAELHLPPKPMHHIPLGADFTAPSAPSHEEGGIDAEIVRQMQGRKFLLTVGTIEPRKNHKVLVDAYEQYLSQTGVDVVIVGKIGWDMQPLLERIQALPQYENGIFVFSGVNDATLDFLYQKAFMVVFPSYAEGYGLPTIEALMHGIPVLCSDLPVMQEIGGAFGDYFPPDDAAALAKIVLQYHENPFVYEMKKQQLLNEYQPPCWTETAEKMEALLSTPRNGERFPHQPVKQIVFLSARPEPILATLPYIETFMPFLQELVVCCPDAMAEFLQTEYHGRLKLTTVTDDTLLAGKTLPPDHSTRNFFLRCLAMDLDVLNDEFIMCDDDYRPMQMLSEEVFYRDGKYRGYYFSDIRTWKYRISALYSYDYCHFRTLRFLQSQGYPTLQYSSHQPQIINRQWYREVIAKHPEMVRQGYDEWSIYFNYCAAEHPDQYAPEPYATLSWPNIGGEEKGVTPKQYLFENFYSDNYERGRQFAGLQKGFTDERTVLQDNRQKKKLAMQYRSRYGMSAEQRKKYVAAYEAVYQEIPHIGIRFPEHTTETYLGCPCTMMMHRTFYNKIPIGISRAEHTAANLAVVTLHLQLEHPETGEVYCTRAVRIPPRLCYTTPAILLPQHIPAECNALRMRITLQECFGLRAKEVCIPVQLIPTYEPPTEEAPAENAGS